MNALFPRINLKATLIIVLVLAALGVEILSFLYSPSFPVLPPRTGGIWLRPNMPVNLQIYKNRNSRATFRKRLSVSGPPRALSLSLTAYRDVTLSLDGAEIPLQSPASWKQAVAVTIPARLLPAGSHELRLVVANRMAHPVVHINSDTAEMVAADGWESSLDGNGWLPARLCDDAWDVTIRKDFPTVYEGVWHSLPLLLPLFVIVFTLSCRAAELFRRVVQPARVRYLLLLLWIILGCNNMFKVSLNLGFDPGEHFDYVFHLLDYHRLPLATDGWQMFQPPVFYVVTALLYKLLMAVVSEDATFHLTRIVQLFSGMLLVEITFRTLRRLFSDNPQAQSCGLVIGALLPMNLYMCQYVGNEPLTAAFTALALYLAVKIFTRSDSVPLKDAALLGIVTGIAILTKVTPVLLVPVISVFLVIFAGARKESNGAWWRIPAVFLAATALVSGWYFARNWILLGKPFVAGWDANRNFVWWQDPSYRIFKNFYAFGESLSQPVYACFNGFADAVYATFWHDGYISAQIMTGTSPPWNYNLLAAALLLSLVPSAAMIMGGVSMLRNSGNKKALPLTFFLAAILVYFSALLYLYASLPIFSTAKASYTMGLTPCYAALAACGASYILRFNHLKNIFVALLITWAVLTYCGFFVI